jgi:diacylglycerol O-acyltransferase
MNEGMLPRDRPLWQLRVVEGVEMEAGGAGYETPGSEGGSVAVLAKLHHAMMDGVAGMRFMGALLSRAPQAQPIESEPGDTRLLQAPETGVLIGRAVRDLGNRPWRITTAAARTLLQTARRLRTRGELIEVPRTVLNGQAGHERRVAILTVPIGLVRDVARDGDATVNDVVVTIVGGALRKALEATGDLPERPLVAAIPVSTHDDGDALTNAYSPIFTSLHTGEPDALRRLRLVRDSARKAKIDRSRDGGNALDAWADIPIPLETALFSRAYSLLNRTEQLTPLCNCLISNVQGPSVPLHLAGARVAGVYPLGPIIDGVGLNVTVLSREDALDIGIVAGALAPGDLWSFGRSISAELDALAKGLEPRHPPSERRPQWPA